LPIRRSTKAEILILIAVFIWGSSSPILKLAFDSMSPGIFNMCRFTLALAAIWILLPPENLREQRQAILAGCLLGILFTGGVLCRSVGLVYTTATKASFISSGYVLLTPFLAILIYKKPPKLAAAAGAVLATTGLYFMTMPEGWGLNLGDLLNGITAVFYAFHLIYLQIFTEKYAFRTLFFFQILSAIFVSGAYAFFFENVQWALTPYTAFAIFFTGLISIAVGIGVQTRFQKYSTPTKVAVIHATEPIWAAIIALPLIGEVLSPIGWLGAVITLVGFLVSELWATVEPTQAS
jgi:drug/metabolite transporter (DMT)-like permease